MTISQTIFNTIKSDLLKTILFQSSEEQISSEAVELCLSILQTPPQQPCLQMKTENITAIRTPDSVVIAKKNHKSHMTGTFKQCRQITYCKITETEPLKLTIQDAVLLKTLKKQTMRNQEKLLYEEGQFAQQLNHIRFMVQTFFCGTFISKKRSDHFTKEKSFIVSELCTRDLYAEIEYFLSEGDKIHIGRQMILAVAELHKMEYFHRDIKVENFFLKSNKEVVLGDFGFTHSKNKLLNAIVGTPPNFSSQYAFLKLQELKGISIALSSEILEREDLWALGCALYNLFFKATIGFPRVKKEWRDWDQKKFDQHWEKNLNAYFNKQRNSSKEYQMIDFLRSILVVSPEKPMTAQEVLIQFDQLFLEEQ